MRPVFGTLAILLLTGTMAHATTILSRTTEQLFHDSDLVAVAQVDDVQAVRSGSQITTHATLTLTESLKGPQTGTQVEVLIPGGIVGEWGERVEGAPTLTPGERVVVFLSRAGRDRYRFTGLEQGKLSIQPDRAHPGQSMVHRTLTAQFMERGPDGRLREATPLPEAEPLQAYLTRLRSLAGVAR